jgi:hypothetical protein
MPWAYGWLDREPGLIGPRDPTYDLALLVVRMVQNGQAGE